jgi:hypothetical protein
MNIKERYLAVYDGAWKQTVSHPDAVAERW